LSLPFIFSLFKSVHYNYNLFKGKSERTGKEFFCSHFERFLPFSTEIVTLPTELSLQKATKSGRQSPAIKQGDERCLPLRASDVAFGNDVYFVSDVTPDGVMGKHHIILRLRRKASLCVSTTSL
jgi:hypothetical protein